MAWVLKMDEVIESGLVHDFDASLTGIGQELGAGAYSMRYGTSWAGRADGRTPPYPWEGPAGPRAFARRGCDQRCPGPPRLGVRACRVAAGARQPRRPLPTPVAGLGGRPYHLRPRNRRGFHFCCKTRPAVNDGLGLVGKGFHFLASDLRATQSWNIARNDRAFCWESPLQSFGVSSYPLCSTL